MIDAVKKIYSLIFFFFKLKKSTSFTFCEAYSSSISIKLAMSISTSAAVLTMSLLDSFNTVLLDQFSSRMFVLEITEASVISMIRNDLLSVTFVPLAEFFFLIKAVVSNSEILL